MKIELDRAINDTTQLINKFKEMDLDIFEETVLKNQLVILIELRNMKEAKHEKRI